MGVERIESGRRGDVLVRMKSMEWYRSAQGSVRPIVPAQDPDLPLAARLGELEREGPVELLAYRPGRRMVLRVGSGAERRIVKGFRKGRLAPAHERHALAVAAAEGTGLRAPRIRGVSAESAALELEDLGGRAVSLGSEGAAIAERVGSALASFRGFALDSGQAAALARHGAAEELAVLEQAAERTLRLRGGLPDGWRAAKAHCWVLAPDLPVEGPVLAHRDLHDGQLLELGSAGGSELGLLDFDLLCRGDRWLDPANLSAHFTLRALQGVPGASLEAADSWSEALYLSSRRDPREGDRARFDFYRATTFLRLALVYGLRPDWVQLAPALIRKSRESVQRSLSNLRFGGDCKGVTT